jgi:calcium binding protein 39
MIDNLQKVDFEGKKDIASIFNNLLRRQIGNRSPTVDHIVSKSEILFKLINGYVNLHFYFFFLIKFFIL